MNDILAILLLLVTIQSTVFLLVKLKVKFIEWIFFNPCALSNIVFLTGYISQKIVLTHAAILPMFFFGTLGMIFFSWGGMNIIQQIGHIIMTANIILAVSGTIFQQDNEAKIGLLLGIIIFAPFIAFQQKYTKEHNKRFEEILLNPHKNRDSDH